MILPLLEAGVQSPSLGLPGGGVPHAYELKFLVDEAQAREVEGWAARRLALDPHGDPELGGAYDTTSLYCDTPEMDVYHRRGSHRWRKFRVRRYGDAPWVFLERKARWGDRVAKRRTRVPLEDLALLAGPLAEPDWAGEWFQRRLLRGLLPACRIAYRRSAYLGGSAQDPLRLTLDRDVRGVSNAGWELTRFEGGIPLLAGRVILELKFHAALPGLFKELVVGLRLSPGAVSKYRLCRQAWGLPARREVGCA